MKKDTIEFEDIIGRYFNLEITIKVIEYMLRKQGPEYLICLHTELGRQFRHILNDKITDKYRVIVFDLPWHGKSNPREVMKI